MAFDSINEPVGRCWNCHNETTMSSTNRQFKLAARPVGMPKESDFSLADAPMPAPTEGQVLVRTAYLSVDPYMRGRITGIRTYADPVNVGDVMVGGTVGQVVESKVSGVAAGDFVVGDWGWQEYAAADGRTLQKLDPKIAPVSTALGVLGMPGMTAYFGFLEICRPQAGETTLVSGAAGAGGSLAGQIEKIKEGRAAGIRGA